MQTLVFNQLREKLECDTGRDLDTIGLRAKYGIYEISFYGCEEDNYELIVEDFGRMIKGKWEQLEPTEAQNKTMQELLNAKADELYELKEQEEEEEREAIKDAQEWEETKDFINANFYTHY